MPVCILCHCSVFVNKADDIASRTRSYCHIKWLGMCRWDLSCQRELPARGSVIPSESTLSTLVPRPFSSLLQVTRSRGNEAKSALVEPCFQTPLKILYKSVEELGNEATLNLHIARELADSF